MDVWMNVFYNRPAFREFLQWTPLIENEGEQPITMMANNAMHPYPIIMVSYLRETSCM